MTREEAIKIIDCYDIGFYDLSGEKIHAYKLADAFDMAIEALSVEATKRLKGKDAKVIVIDASAEAVQGEWEHWGSPFSDESEVIDTIVCSVCGARFIEPKDEPKGEYNYCPNCGAKMKGGEE